MAAGDALRHIAINHVKPDHAQDLEKLIDEEIVPLVARTRPHLVGQWS